MGYFSEQAIGGTAAEYEYDRAMDKRDYPVEKRVIKAAGICERAEVVPMDREGYYRVRDTATGSGKVHVATATSCDCYDAGRGNHCKHQRAVVREQAALDAYAAAWDAQAQPRCPECGGRLESMQYYVGGRGYQMFMVCKNDGTHNTRKA